MKFVCFFHFWKKKFDGFKVVFLFASGVFLNSCQSIHRSPSSARTIATKQENRIVGYMTSWNRVPEEYLKQRQLSHVIYAFAIPYVTGAETFQIGVPQVFLHNRTHYLATRSFLTQTKSMIAIGGYRAGSELVSPIFEKIVRMENGVERLSQSIMNICEEFQLDGVDIDWEFPTRIFQTQFAELIQNLRSKMDQSRSCKILSVAVPTRVEDTEGFGNTWFNIVDFVNIMAYDYNGETHHSSYAHAQNALNMWVQNGLMADKAVLGVPFYSKPRIYKYSQIYEMNPENADRDEAQSPRGVIYYNGEVTLKQKSKLAKQYGGIMIWELGQDSKQKPLMNVIEEEMAN